MVYEGVRELQPTIENRELLEMIARDYGATYSRNLGAFLVKLFGRDDIERDFGSIENFIRTTEGAAYKWFVEEWPGVKVKEIIVNPHSALSYQKHEHRGEFWVVQSGSGTFVKEDRHYPVKKGDTFLVLKWEWHQIVNGNNEPLVVIETQFGDQVVEDDIKRK